MSQEKDTMLTEMENYFNKVQAAVTASAAASFRYKTGSVPANGSVVIDTVVELGYVAANYNVYSIGIQLACPDPTIVTNPPVIDAQAVLRWEIAADGKVTIRNNHTAAVVYHARITMPVKK